MPNLSTERERLEAATTRPCGQSVIAQRSGAQGSLTPMSRRAFEARAKPYLVCDQPRDVGLAVMVQPTGGKAFYCYTSTRQRSR
ncbi:MAG TPA: hypothetical protein VG758_07450 [Hyphomicrobiaceae bacterium]|nr:hypothetical protein [Hyphomicrobiaceae bacterium]